MSLLTITAANAYPGFVQVEFMLRNLAAQTYRDFELIILDISYDDNKDKVVELSTSLGLNDVIHLPTCRAKHVAQHVHWEIFNNSLALASSPWIFQFGIYRYVHRRVIETIIDRASRNICIVFPQNHVEAATLQRTDYDLIESLHGMSADTVPCSYLTQSGFFSINRDVFIDQLNGHTEALTAHHWVDCDLSQRAKNATLNVQQCSKGLLRIDRLPGDLHYHGALAKTVCSHELEDCPWNMFASMSYADSHLTDNPNTVRIDQQGYGWLQCRRCGILIVETPNAFMEHLDKQKIIKAPINLGGVGRNLRILADDLRGKTISEKTQILRDSHTNPRYLSA